MKSRINRFVYQLTHWETWPYLVKYIPMAPAWTWFCIRSRAIWFFTPANPTLTFGGFEGEAKTEMYRQLPLGSYPESVLIDPNDEFTAVEAAMQKQGLRFPVVVKPDVGMMGFMFRIIKNREQLQRYHNQMFASYLLQDYVSYPIEVSVFYYREPGKEKGTITGFIRKEYMELTGNGLHDIETLMENYPRAQYRLKELKSKHASVLHKVLNKGEIFRLSDALNLSRGGRLVSMESEKDDTLLALFDQLSSSGPFYYGRYDIKCNSISALKEGREFSILEFNGTGAEPHHMYGNNNTLLQAWKIMWQHWSMLYRIAAANHKQGVPYWKWKDGWSFMRHSSSYFKRLKALDQSLELN